MILIWRWDTTLLRNEVTQNGYTFIEGGSLE
jgi:hypothetical protein